MPDAFFPEAVNRLREAMEPQRNESTALAMARYMRGMFPFLGIPSPRRRQLQADAVRGLSPPTADELVEVAQTLWDWPEREYQYAACDILSRHARTLRADQLSDVRALIVTKSWWDTVDALASHVVGSLVQRNPDLAAEMDRWVRDTDIWVVRTALLHQLRFKRQTDVPRLFRYCAQQAGHSDFFIRKAIGWALREYSKTDGDAVRRFVAAHEHELSPLSKREALLWLNGGRRGTRSVVGN